MPPRNPESQGFGRSIIPPIPPPINAHNIAVVSVSGTPNPKPVNSSAGKPHSPTNRKMPTVVSFDSPSGRVSFSCSLIAAYHDVDVGEYLKGRRWSEDTDSLVAYKQVGRVLRTDSSKQQSCGNRSSPVSGRRSPVASLVPMADM